MKRVLILVEGQTEETFVREVLAPHLLARNVALTPTILATRRVKSGGHFKGGATSYAKVQGDLHRLLKDTGAERITTMLDYYGLPDDFPGLTDRPTGTCYQRVEHVERAFQADIAHPRFLPYLALHEFEALLFTDPARCAWIFVRRPRSHREHEGHPCPSGLARGDQRGPGDSSFQAHPASLPQLPEDAARAAGHH